MDPLPVAMPPGLHEPERYGEGVEGMLPIAFQSRFVRRNYQDWRREGRQAPVLSRAIDCQASHCRCSWAVFEEAHAPSGVLGRQ